MGKECELPGMHSINHSFTPTNSKPPTTDKSQAIQSAATAQFTTTDPSQLLDLRKPTIFSDAILAILRAPAPLVNGRLLIDEDFLRLGGHPDGGVTDFDKYSVVVSPDDGVGGKKGGGGGGRQPRRIMPLELPDLSVREQDDEGKRYDSAKARAKL